jgi:hypothetical protein
MLDGGSRSLYRQGCSWLARRNAFGNALIQTDVIHVSLTDFLKALVEER